MQITIVKAAGRSHRAVAVRDDGVAVRFAVADYGDRLPHDLVQSTLGLEWGFWGLVAAGAELDAGAYALSDGEPGGPGTPVPGLSERIDEWNATWQGLAPGGRLRFEWPPPPG